jgi:hypothetical protein
MEAPKCPHCGQELLSVVVTDVRLIEWDDSGQYEFTKEDECFYYCYRCEKELDKQFAERVVLGLL